MQTIKEIILCIVPFIIVALLCYPMMAIVGANCDPFLWERTDRMFYFVLTMSFGWMLMLRVQYRRGE